MNKNFLRRYELLVYICISLLSALLFVIGSYMIKSGTVNGVILNLCSELLGVAIVFFIVNRMFPVSQDDNFDKKQLSEDIEKIRDTLTNINQDVTGLTKKITDEIEIKQQQILKLVAKKFSEKTQESHDVLRKAIEKELRKNNIQGSNNLELVETLVGYNKYSMEKMVSSQIQALEQELQKMLDDMQNSIISPVNNLSSEVKILQQQVQKVENQVSSPVGSLPPSN
jgi:predicted PurR-regulated permease PerM